MYQFEPNEIAHKGNDDRLINEGADDIKINLVDPLWLENVTQNK
jgi:hypothetical protein